MKKESKYMDEKVAREHNSVSRAEFVGHVMNAMPCPSMILNDEARIVFVNKALTSTLSIGEVDEVLGLRPGDLFACRYGCEAPDGCGSGDACRYCATLSTILESQKTNKPVSRDSLLISSRKGNSTQFDFKVLCTPMQVEDQEYTVMTLTDISDRKRKEFLERIFLHDLAEQTNNLQGLASLIKESNEPEEVDSLADILEALSTSINEGIVSYRDLLAAENNSLTMNIVSIDAGEVLDSTLHSATYRDIARNKEVVVERPEEAISIRTEPILLQRILLHMLQNALEATADEGRVRLGYRREGDAGVLFFVENEAVIPDELKPRIFERSFSTKGQGRGTGTYTMRLLGERYLSGKVDFESEPARGTRFYITLPLSISK